VDRLQPLPDSLWAQPCLAYHVQPDLASETQAELHRLQESVVRHWPGALHLCPRDTLHVTIYALVPVRDGFDKHVYWGQIAARSETVLRDLCDGTPAFHLHFERLKVTTSAIIAVARDDSGFIETIRQTLTEAIPPPPGGTPPRYDLIHSTLARHRSPGPVPGSALHAVEGLPVSISAPVRGIRIIRETVFPCLVQDRIVTIPLR